MRDAQKASFDSLQPKGPIARRNRPRRHAYFRPLIPLQIVRIYRCCPKTILKAVSTPFSAAGSIEGVFGPASLTWRVDREAAVFLGARRALLLQLAHPWVAAAIAEHSPTFADPISRFQQNTVFTMVFRTRDQSLASARPPPRPHAAETGILPR